MQRLALALLGLAGCAGEIDVKTFTYDDRAGPIQLDVYAPPGATDTPGVLVIHGGGWISGSRDEPGPMSRRLAEAGYVAVSIDYRLAPDHVFPVQVQDSFCALAWMRKHADEIGLDPDRIASHGFSAGSHMASMTAVAADDDFLQDPGCPSGRTGPVSAAIVGDSGYDLSREENPITRKFIGQSLASNQDLYREASPIYHIDANEPPFLLFHARGDLAVSDEESIDMRDALRAAGNDARLLLIEGGGHAFNEGGGLGFEQYERAFEAPIIWPAIIDFLDHTIGAR